MERNREAASILEFIGEILSLQHRRSKCHDALPPPACALARDGVAFGAEARHPCRRLREQARPRGCGLGACAGDAGPAIRSHSAPVAGDKRLSRSEVVCRPDDDGKRTQQTASLRVLMMGSDRPRLCITVISCPVRMISSHARLVEARWSPMPGIFVARGSPVE